MFRGLTKYLHELPQGRYGRWVLDRTHDGSAQQPIELPFVDYTEAVDAFIIDVFQFAKEHPELGLDDYRVILAEHHIKPGVKSMAEAEVSGLDGRCVLALLVGAVRAERLCDGALLYLLRRGGVQRWLGRLEEIEMPVSSIDTREEKD